MKTKNYTYPFRVISCLFVADLFINNLLKMRKAKIKS